MGLEELYVDGSQIGWCLVVVRATGDSQKIVGCLDDQLAAVEQYAVGYQLIVETSGHGDEFAAKLEERGIPHDKVRLTTVA